MTFYYIFRLNRPFFFVKHFPICSSAFLKELQHECTKSYISNLFFFTECGELKRVSNVPHAKLALDIASFHVPISP